MTKTYKPHPSILKGIGYSLVALLFGFLHLFLTPFQITTAVPFVTTLISVPLYIGGGIVPLALLAICSIGATAFVWGIPFALVTFPAYVVPASVMLYMICTKKPFFKQLAVALLAALLSAGVSIVLATVVYGSDMIAKAVEMLRPTIDMVIPMLWTNYESVFESAGVTITYDEFVTMYNEFIMLAQNSCELSLLSNVLTGASITVLAGEMWGNWLLARRGEASSENFKGLADWHLPQNMILGMGLTLIVGLLVKDSSIRGAQIAWKALSSLVSLACFVQAIAALDRNSKRKGIAVGRRRFRVGLAIFVTIIGGSSIYSIFVMIGALSALFGHQGVVTNWKNRQNQKDTNGQNR